MGRTPQDVTDAELAVLKVLWEHGGETIRRVTEILYPNQSESDYATVKKLLSRLEAKQCVRRDRGEMAHRFEATISLDDLVGRRLEALANNLCGGSSEPLLMHLLHGADVTPRQQEELRRLIREKSRKPNSTRKTQD